MEVPHQITVILPPLQTVPQAYQAHYPHLTLGMATKTVKDQLLAFLQANQSTYHSGDLQRMFFKTRRGGYATGDNIKRRLNELAEEGAILVSYNDRHEALFSAKKQPLKLREHTVFYDGKRVVRDFEMMPV